MLSLSLSAATLAALYTAVQAQAPAFDINDVPLATRRKESFPITVPSANVLRTMVHIANYPMPSDLSPRKSGNCRHRVQYLR
jgi:hypothetical protein